MLGFPVKSSHELAPPPEAVAEITFPTIVILLPGVKIFCFVSSPDAKAKV